MTKLPDEWIDRIFLRLKEIYHDRFEQYYGKIEKHSTKHIMWSNALIGLTANEIKQALHVCSKFPLESVPTPIEFYHYAKGISYPSHLISDRRLAPNYESNKYKINNLLNTLKLQKNVMGKGRYEY